jgi:four helix bundle protein
MEKGYKKLKVYDEAHALVKDVYIITAQFPKEELFGLVSQMRRSAVSVVANIIEGQARLSKREFRNFLSIANGSLTELEYYLELCFDIKYITKQEYERIEMQRVSVGKLLGGLLRYFRNQS